MAGWEPSPGACHGTCETLEMLSTMHQPRDKDRGKKKFPPGGQREQKEPLVVGASPAGGGGLCRNETACMGLRGSKRWERGEPGPKLALLVRATTFPVPKQLSQGDRR